MDTPLPYMFLYRYVPMLKIDMVYGVDIILFNLELIQGKIGIDNHIPRANIGSINLLDVSMLGAQGS